MRLLLAAAALACLPAAAQEAGWGPVADELAPGSGTCLDGEDVLCAVVLCEKRGELTLGVLEAGLVDVRPPFRARIEVDGEGFEREMTARLVMEESHHLRTPVEPGEQLWRRLRAGTTLALPAASEGEPLDYTLRGSAVELDRVAAACR